MLYGNKLENKNLQVDYNTFAKVYKTAGESSLVDLSVENAVPVKVLIHEVSRNPVTHRFAHIDFYAINMTEKLTTRIPLKFVGEAPAVKELGGVLVKTIDELEISCLPNDLVPEIEVDITRLKTFSDMLHTSDIVLPKGITAMAKTNEVVVKVTAPRSEEELKALETEVKEEVGEVKVLGEEERKAKEEAAAAQSKKGE